MLNLQRQALSTATESRVFPRIEFHFPVTIIGVDSNAQIIDFSLTGFYIESDQVSRIAIKQKINLALKLPAERTSIVIKAEVVHWDKNGFGCKFWNPNPDIIAALERCFDIHAGMLPIE